MKVAMRAQILGILTVALFFSSYSRAGVILTFDQAGLFAGQSIHSGYGDRVTTSPDGSGHSYQLVTDGFGNTPNVLASYPSGAFQDSKLWTSDYGDLLNVLYNATNGSSSLSMTLSADAGFEVGLFGFDLGGWPNTDYTIAGYQVFDESSAVLASAGSTLVRGANSTHTDIDFAGGVFAQSLTIDVDLGVLGGASDDIGLDNVYFVQRRQRIPIIPEPSTLSIWGLLLLTFVAEGCHRPWRRK